MELKMVGVFSIKEGKKKVNGLHEANSQSKDPFVCFAPIESATVRNFSLRTYFSDLRVIWILGTTPGMEFDFLPTTQRVTAEIADMIISVEE